MAFLGRPGHSPFFCRGRLSAAAGSPESRSAKRRRGGAPRGLLAIRERRCNGPAVSEYLAGSTRIKNAGLGRTCISLIFLNPYRFSGDEAPSSRRARGGEAAFAGGVPSLGVPRRLAAASALLFLIWPSEHTLLFLLLAVPHARAPRAAVAHARAANIKARNVGRNRRHGRLVGCCRVPLGTWHSRRVWSRARYQGPTP